MTLKWYHCNVWILYMYRSGTREIDICMKITRDLPRNELKVTAANNHHPLNILKTSSTLWGRVTHICVSKQTIIGSDNGLSPGRRQAIIWTNAGILLIGTKGTNFSEVLIEIRIFLFKKMGLNVFSGKWRPFCLGLNVLTHWGQDKMAATLADNTFKYKFVNENVLISMKNSLKFVPEGPINNIQHCFR